MEILFRKYFWAVELALLAVISFLGALTTNALLAARLVAPVDLDAMAPSSSAGNPGAAFLARAGSLPLERTAAFLGIELPSEDPTAGEPEMPAYDPDAEAVPSSLNLTLVGTMVANRPEWSFATIRKSGGEHVGVYLVGDEIEGATVLEIERLRVILLNQGRKEYIAIDESKTGELQRLASATPTPSATSSRGGAPQVEPAEVRQVGNDTYEISREDVERQLANLSALATQARVVPSFKDGKANGFKIFSIRPGSLYQKIGLQNGDVIRKINGYAIDSPEKALELYAKLRESSRIEVELERRGKVQTKTVNVR
ncbi:MAG: type II secretion system protein GspC [Pseudomonadota bacterium]|mgnify:CR=1 FL=1|nr:MAG: general secretion pathway protein GspC [Pseudomonadota bacterium]